MEKLNLIYVASIGRSGSTLLECMLGAHSKMASAGELEIWPHEIMDGGVLPTGSGKYVQEDPFWMEMERRVDPLKQPEPQIHFFREAHNAGRTLRTERIAEFKNKPLSATVNEQIRQFGQNNYEVFSNFLDLIAEQEGERPNWVVDASKDPYRLLWLVRSGLFNVKVVQLVKDPRGFIYSVTKPHIHAEDFALHRRLWWTFRQAGAWSIRNHLIAEVAEHHLPPEDYLLVQYEELASDPEGTFGRVCNMIGAEFEQQAVDNFREGSPYAIAGNPMRQRSGGIKLDEKWKTTLPTTSRLLTTAITSVNMKRFGD
ncbi:MAG: sulfotransferase [Rhodothermales bacterium]